MLLPYITAENILYRISTVEPIVMLLEMFDFQYYDIKCTDDFYFLLSICVDGKTWIVNHFKDHLSFIRFQQMHFLFLIHLLKTKHNMEVWKKSCICSEVYSWTNNILLLQNLIFIDEIMWYCCSVILYSCFVPNYCISVQCLSVGCFINVKWPFVEDHMKASAYELHISRPFAHN